MVSPVHPAEQGRLDATYIIQALLGAVNKKIDNQN